MNVINLGNLVLQKYDNYKHAIEIVNFCLNTTKKVYPILVITYFSNSLNSLELSVNNILQTNRSKHILENQKNIKPMIEAIILRGRQNIPLKRHNEFEPFIN